MKDLSPIKSLLAVLCLCMFPSPSGLFFVPLHLQSTIILRWLQFLLTDNFQHHSWTRSLLKALLGKLPTLNSSQILDWPPYGRSRRERSCQLFSFFHFCVFPSIPPFSHLFFRLVAGAPCCWAVTGFELVGGSL